MLHEITSYLFLLILLSLKRNYPYFIIIKRKTRSIRKGKKNNWRKKKVQSNFCSIEKKWRKQLKDENFSEIKERMKKYKHFC